MSDEVDDPLRRVIAEGPYRYRPIDQPHTWPRRDPLGLILLFKALREVGVPGVGGSPGLAERQQYLDRVQDALEAGDVTALAYDEVSTDRTAIAAAIWQGDAGTDVLLDGWVWSAAGQRLRVYFERVSLPFLANYVGATGKTDCPANALHGAGSADWWPTLNVGVKAWSAASSPAEAEARRQLIASGLHPSERQICLRLELMWHQAGLKCGRGSIATMRRTAKREKKGVSSPPARL